MRNYEWASGRKTIWYLLYSRLITAGWVVGGRAIGAERQRALKGFLFQQEDITWAEQAFWWEINKVSETSSRRKKYASQDSKNRGAEGGRPRWHDFVFLGRLRHRRRSMDGRDLPHELRAVIGCFQSEEK